MNKERESFYARHLEIMKIENEKERDFSDLYTLLDQMYFENFGSLEEETIETFTNQEREELRRRFQSGKITYKEAYKLLNEIAYWSNLKKQNIEIYPVL